MADQSIFDNQSQQATPAQNQSTPQASDYSDLLSQIRNESGEPKYKSVHDALIGLQNAQQFIQTLKAEKIQVEQELTQVRPVAEKVSELEKVVLALTSSSNQAAASPAAAGLSEDAIAKLVESTLTRKQQEDVSKQNLESVVSTVQKIYGDKAAEMFYGKASELGMSKEEVNALAARTPKAVLKLLGIENNTPSFSPTTSSVNTSSLQPRTDTFIARNTTKLEVGATSQEIHKESQNARKMVDELAQKGMSIDDLTKPSNYFKFFS